MKNIVCLSSACWYPFPTRKQHVMSRLPDCRVLYFDPPVTLAAPLRDRSAAKKLTAFRRRQPKPQENITVFSLPPVLPFYNKFRWINRINQRIIARFVRRRMKEAGMERPLLWCYLPSSCDGVELIPHDGLVYDCVDRHSAYGGTMDPQLVDRMEEALARRCDAVFCTAAGLYETLSRFNDRTHLIPNGVDYARFSLAASPLPCPEDLAGAPRPIFGFVGMLQSCIDYDLALALADACPEATLVFIGRTLPGVDISPLEARKNIRLLGLKPFADLPYYLAQFDVCLNLFRPGALSKDVSPLKFYEYLATGKPIVSTPEPVQVRSYEEWVPIASEPEDFVRKCLSAAAENDPERVRARMAQGEAASWEGRCAAMLDALRAAGVDWPSETED